MKKPRFLLWLAGLVLFVMLSSFSTKEAQVMRRARSLLLPDSRLQLR